MFKVVVEVEGLREAQEALRSMLPDRTARNVMRRVLKKRATPIRNKAKSLAPYRRGKLKSRIEITGKLHKGQRSSYRKQHPDDVELFVAAGPLPWAHMMEYGTKDVKPHPYMRPAWDQVRHTILQHVAKDMWDEIEKALARMARKAARK
jgi:HK97 gp10 family phage protein